MKTVELDEALVLIEKTVRSYSEDYCSTLLEELDRNFATYSEDNEDKLDCGVRIWSDDSNTYREVTLEDRSDVMKFISSVYQMVEEHLYGEDS